jgi:phosphotransferase system  glucose/maltose/N-acetylglucosamine-specific IIC component
MAIFQFFKGVTHSIEAFDRETVPGFDSYDPPMDYGFLQNDNFHAPSEKLKFLTFQIGENTVEHCAADPDVLKISDGDSVDVVYSGRSVVALLNKNSGYYCFYKKPLYKKFSFPKVLMGINSAVVAIVIGYILHLIALQLRSDLFQVISEGTTLFFFVGGLIYAAYYHTNQAYAKSRIAKYIRQIGGL